jgi:hypothetical protein
MKFQLLLTFNLLVATCSIAQNPPWENPLNLAWSSDGKIFGTPSVFQDSAGVPSVIRWKGDTLIAAFQWFRLPQNTPSWDRVAVKFSYDAGQNWTPPVPIVVDGIPANYQRPFDPTLVVFGGDSLRIYFSSSVGIPMGGLNATVNTYSAKSHDGVHYSFEPNARVDHPTTKVIDPAVIYFNNGWHFTAPIGAPQEGAYHYVSPDGLNFSPVPNIPSDNQHNWTGNLMLNNATELRFYGSGPLIWYNASSNGGQWNGFVHTNIQGGDPSVLQVSTNIYLMVYVGPPNSTGLEEAVPEEGLAIVYPNPARDFLHLFSSDNLQEYDYGIFRLNGQLVNNGHSNQNSVDLGKIPSGVYLLNVRTKYNSQYFKFFKN